MQHCCILHVTLLFAFSLPVEALQEVSNVIRRELKAETKAEVEVEGLGAQVTAMIKATSNSTVSEQARVESSYCDLYKNACLFAGQSWNYCCYNVWWYKTSNSWAPSASAVNLGCSN